VADIDGAQWSSEVVGSAVHARLAAGTASFHVEHTQGRQRFLLHTPDGQIEVHGTRFRVEVDRGATRSVRVTEGVVSLRVHGEPEIWLAAGDEWRAARGDAAPATSLPPSAAAPPLEVAARDSKAEDVAPAKRRGSDADRAGAALPDAFASAVAALRSGKYRRAEQLFDVFLSQSARDDRAEDAWFLKAVARSRSGDGEGASRLARDYLQRFPNGLRRREAEQIATSGESPDREGNTGP
jgi:TolA-binding protein